MIVGRSNVYRWSTLNVDRGNRHDTKVVHTEDTGDGNTPVKN